MKLTIQTQRGQQRTNFVTKNKIEEQESGLLCKFKCSHSSKATIVQKSKRLDFAILHCEDGAFNPLPVRLELQRFFTVVHCHYPIARELGVNTVLNLRLPKPHLDWSIETSDGVVGGTDRQSNAMISNYQAFPGSGGFPIVRCFSHLSRSLLSLTLTLLRSLRYPSRSLALPRSLVLALSL